MNIDVLSPSSDSSSDSRTSSSSGESLDEFHRNILQGGEVLGYQFEPRRNTNSVSAELAKTTEDDQSMSIEEEGFNRSFVWVILTGKTS
jgi:hypothetical protein